MSAPTQLTPAFFPEKALVLFSGGQDSATCLAWALDRYRHVETIGFAYGQRHAVELECRAPIRAAIGTLWPGRLGADHTIDLSGTLGDLSATALTSDRVPVNRTRAMCARSLTRRI